MEIFSLVFFFALVSSSAFVDGEGGGVFKIQHKFGKVSDRSLQELTSHDTTRHERHLSAINVPLGGNGKLSGTGQVLYFTKLSIGSPPKDFFLHVDTGSDVLWVNCARCSPCRPTYTDDNSTLNLYDPTLSSTAGLVPCSGDFCTEYRKGGRHNSDCSSNKACGYGVGYGDGSKTNGYFVRDIIGFDEVIGNLQFTIGNAGLSFGCGMHQKGTFTLDGIIGFGASTTSFLSQLASSGKVSKKFAHCLDGRNGGGIFVIGDVVQPALKTTPLVRNAPHYNVNMKSIQVGNSIRMFPNSKPKMILSSQPNLTTQLVKCFDFNKSIDDSFPTVILGFENSLELNVYPHHYLIPNKFEGYCFGWLDSQILKSDLIILGDLVLEGKLVLYDVENQNLGLSDYDCSSTIGLKDDMSGVVNQVAGSNSLSSSPARRHKDISASPAHQHFDFGMVVKLFLLSLFMLYNYV
ncbi:hypothetical protein C5167_025143 [Papaver somniferum]|uniref:Peptidase A1 domain-containing protein n=1 Tax=Papaver somniferum TaxID=3469 RepID=A0A4Y7JTK7_PAPSO|nr:hypothetical protein C5167_025143 [Papaver somniferum]